MTEDPDAALLDVSRTTGWPAPVDGGWLFVTTEPGAWSVAGDFEGWAGLPMTEEAGYSWLVANVPDASGYKFTDGTNWAADPWSRQYTYDDFGEMSLLNAEDAHLERLFAVSDGTLAARTVRAWVPAEPATHVLYVHDGQNLFDPSASWGGWHLQDSVPAAMLVVGIDNTAARMDEYTHVPDSLDGELYGGQGDAYAAFLEGTVRPLADATWGEPATVGVMGSSLGGLISFHVADRAPGEYAFAASLSGTMGWGSIGADNETMIARYAAAGHRGTALYLDSGGYGTTCADADGVAYSCVARTPAFDGEPSSYAARAWIASFMNAGVPRDRRIAEKTPHNLVHGAWLGRLFPRARFIHVLRDGHAVAESLVRQRWCDPATGELVPYCQNLTNAASYWATVVTESRRQGAQLPRRYLEVRYETLISRPRETMAEVLAFLGEPWDDAVLAHETAGVPLSTRESSTAAVGQARSDATVDAWRHRLSPADIQAIEKVAGPALRAAGY